MTKTLKLIIGCAVLIVLIKIMIIGWLVYSYYHSPLIRRGDAQTIKIPPNSDVNDLAYKLYRRNLFHHPKFFIFMSRRNGHTQKIRYGEYWIKPGMSSYELMNNIIRGKGLVRHHITFIEGSTFSDMKKVLAEEPDLKHELKNKSNQDIMTLLKSPYKKPEGLFFPSTYYFLWGDSDLEILETAYQKMQTFLEDEWAKRKKGLPYKNSYQALIVASLIEKETAVEDEKSTIAGVIINRLKRHMRLQIDPTVLYGLRKPYDTEITKEDLLSKTSYNTYYIKGLPPTPIDMPSASSIVAALHPEKHRYFYYVAKGDGSHQFSTTYKEHMTAIEKYREKESEMDSEDEARLYHYPIEKKIQTVLKITKLIINFIETVPAA